MGELFAMKTPSEELTLEGLQSLEWPLVVQPKYDGVRGLWVGSRFYSFSGKPFWNIPHLEAACRKGIVLDGELVGDGMSMAETNGVLKATTGRDGRKIRFHVFDLLDLKEWDSKICDRPWDERDKTLHRYIPESGGDIRVVPSTLARNAEHALALHAQIGGEGIMLKNPKGLYYWRRHEDWLRYKPDWTEDFEILAAEEGKGKWEGSLGQFLVKDQRTGVTTWVGGGRITKATRDEWWDRWHKGSIKVGDLVEVIFKTRTKDGKLREPRLLRLREDKE